MTPDPSDRNRNQTEGSEHARILTEVMEDQKRRRSQRDEADQGRPTSADTSFFVQVALLVTGTFFFYLLFFSPTWIAPTTPEPIAQERVDDGLRMAIVLAVRQVEAFEDQRGRLPDNLREIDFARDGLEYERIDARTYRVRASRDSASITYDSTQSLSEFASDAVERTFGERSSS